MSKKWNKIWGTNTELFTNTTCSVNVLNIVKGGTCSLHKHKSNYNHFYVVSGKLKVLIEGVTHILFSGNDLTVFPNQMHQFTAEEESVVVETVYVELNKLDINRKTKGFVKP